MAFYATCSFQVKHRIQWCILYETNGHNSCGLKHFFLRFHSIIYYSRIFHLANAVRAHKENSVPSHLGSLRNTKRLEAIECRKETAIDSFRIWSSVIFSSQMRSWSNEKNNKLRISNNKKKKYRQRRKEKEERKE